MSGVSQRISKVAKEFNVGVDTILEFLETKGVDNLNRNSKISPETYDVLVEEYQPDKKVKAEAKELKKAEAESNEQPKEESESIVRSSAKIEGLKIVSKLDVDELKATSGQPQTKDSKSEEKTEKIEPSDDPDSLPASPKSEVTTTPTQEQTPSTIIRAKAKKLEGPTIVNSEKIDLSKFDKPKKKTPIASSSSKVETKKKRRRVIKESNQSKKSTPRTPNKPELNAEEIQKQVRENLAKLQGSGKNKAAKIRREKRLARKEQEEIDQIKHEEQSKTIQVTEFVTTAELAQLMSIQPNQIISACFSCFLFFPFREILVCLRKYCCVLVIFC